MTNTSLHPWTLDPDEAIQLQEDIRKRLVLARCRAFRLPEPIRAAHKVAANIG